MNKVKRWHKRFLQQARWSEKLRIYLFKKAKVSKSSRIIDIGCGTGALLKDLHYPNTYGIDINYDFLVHASDLLNDSKLSCANAYKLPFESNSFDLAYCHYLLLWVHSPVELIKEIKRIIKPGGKIMVLSEPDYSNRKDHPEELIEIGKLQTTALIDQGANPYIGQSIKKIISSLGFNKVESGIIKGNSNYKPSRENWNLEWDILLEDIDGGVGKDEIDKLKEIDWNAWQEGNRILFVPTYYYFGIKVN